MRTLVNPNCGMIIKCLWQVRLNASFPGVGIFISVISRAPISIRVIYRSTRALLRYVYIFTWTIIFVTSIVSSDYSVSRVYVYIFRRSWNIIAFADIVFAGMREYRILEEETLFMPKTIIFFCFASVYSSRSLRSRRDGKGKGSYIPEHNGRCMLTRSTMAAPIYRQRATSQSRCASHFCPFFSLIVFICICEDAYIIASCPLFVQGCRGVAPKLNERDAGTSPNRCTRFFVLISTSDLSDIENLSLGATLSLWEAGNPESCLSTSLHSVSRNRWLISCSQYSAGDDVPLRSNFLI